MIDFASDAEIQKVLAQYDLPKLTFVDRVDAGPDDELYFDQAASPHKNLAAQTDPEHLPASYAQHYAVWSRDYMSSLDEETHYVKLCYDLKIIGCIPLKHPDTYNAYMAYAAGMNYLVFAVKDFDIYRYPQY